MKGFKWGRVAAVALVMALGIAGSIYTGYWSRMGRYVTTIVAPASAEASAEVSAGGAAYHGGAAPSAANAPGAAIAPGALGAAGVGGQAFHGGPQAAGFNASLLPRIAGYATVLGLFAALVRLVDLLRKRRLAARSVEARLMAAKAGPCAAGEGR